MARRGLHVKISDEAHTGWRQFCDDHGISLAALMESIGRRMADGRMRWTDQIEEIVGEARRVDEERKRRPGPRRRIRR